MDSFGKKLRSLRQSSGLSVAALAVATGISRRTIHDWEAGKRLPGSFNSLEILAAVCNVEISYFVDKNNQLASQEDFSQLVKRVEALEQRVFKSEST